MGGLIKDLAGSPSDIQKKGQERFGAVFGNFSLATMWPDLERASVDPMKAIDSHLGTSIFSNKNVPFGRVYDPFVEDPNAPPPISPPDLAAKVITEVTNDVARFATEYFAEQVGDLLNPIDLGTTTALAGQMMAKFLLSANDIKDKVCASTVEEIATKATQAALISATTELSNYVDSTIGKLNDKISNHQQKLQENIQKINDVITSGPKYVCNIADQIDARAKKQIGEEIDAVFKQAKAHKQKMIESISSSQAAKLAQDINNKVEDTTRQAFVKIGEAKGKAENMATSAIKKALLNFFALMGL